MNSGVVPRLREVVRPLVFSAAARPFREWLGRGISSFELPNGVEERIQSRIARLPRDLALGLEPHRQAFLRAVVVGQGLSPRFHRQLLALLGQEPPAWVPHREHPSPVEIASRRLKLLFVTGHFPSVDHGGGILVFDRIRCLAQHHDVSLYSRFGPADDPSWQVLRPSLTHARLIEGETLEPADFREWVERQSGGGGFDGIHFIWPSTSPLMPLARPFCRRLLFEFIECNTLSAVRNLVRLLPSGDEAAGRALYEFMANWQLEATGVAASDVTLAVTDEDAGFVRQFFGGRYPTVFPVCVSDFAIWDRLTHAPIDDGWGLAPEAVFLAFFGHSPNREGAEWYLREVHPRVLARIPRFRVHFAGGGDVSAIKRRYRGDESVVFDGRIDDLVSGLRRYKLCLAPLISGAGVRLKVGQYSAVGRPTVSTSLGVVGTPFKDGESVLVADDAGRFADAVIALLQNESLYREVALNARETAERSLRWGSHLAELEGIYAG